MKEKHVNDHIPIACVPSAMNEEQRTRYNQCLNKIAESKQAISELPNGYEIYFPAESSTIIDLAEFISLERLCCPFLNFELHVKSSDSVQLYLTGSRGVKEFLKETFSWI